MHNQVGEVGSCMFSDGGYTLSDKPQSIFQEVQHKKKRKLHSSFSDSSIDPTFTFTKTDRSYPDKWNETVEITKHYRQKLN